MATGKGLRFLFVFGGLAAFLTRAVRFFLGAASALPLLTGVALARARKFLARARVIGLSFRKFAADISISSLFV